MKEDFKIVLEAWKVKKNAINEERQKAIETRRLLKAGFIEGLVRELDFRGL